MPDINTAVVFPNKEQELWLGFSHFDGYSKNLAGAIADGLRAKPVTPAGLIADVIGEMNLSAERSGVTFDQPYNIHHSIYEFDFANNRVTLYDSAYDEVKVEWTVMGFLKRFNMAPR